MEWKHLSLSELTPYQISLGLAHLCSKASKYDMTTMAYDLETSEPKWANPNDIWYGVNSLSLGGLQRVANDSVLMSLVDDSLIYFSGQ